MDNCTIVGAGPLYTHNPILVTDSLIIAADGGYEHLMKIHIQPDVVIGDFDSMPCRPRHPTVIALSREKDDTDMLAAIKYGLDKGCRSFHIYGGTGGRFDHTIANLQCLAYLALRGAQGFLYGEDFIATCIHNGKMTFDGRHKGTVSVFAHADIAEGVFLEGLKYELHDANLSNDCPRGVSNEFTGAAGRISVRNGTIIIILPYNGTG